MTKLGTVLDGKYEILKKVGLSRRSRMMDRRAQQLS